MAGEGTFEVIAVATSFLFRCSLMDIGVTMFPARVRVVTRIEAVSFGAMFGVRSPFLSCRGALHAASPPGVGIAVFEPTPHLTHPRTAFRKSLPLTSGCCAVK